MRRLGRDVRVHADPDVGRLLKVLGHREQRVETGEIWMQSPVAPIAAGEP